MNTPTDDERELWERLVARHLPLSAPSNTAANIVRHLTEIGVLRRTEVPEPSVDWYDTHCPTCDAPEPWHTATCAVVHVKVPEPQGEPSDTQVEAAVKAFYDSARIDATPDDVDINAMRAALRAAMSLREGGAR